MCTSHAVDVYHLQFPSISRCHGLSRSNHIWKSQIQRSEESTSRLFGMPGRLYGLRMGYRRLYLAVSLINLKAYPTNLKCILTAIYYQQRILVMTLLSYQIYCTSTPVITNCSFLSHLSSLVHLLLEYMCQLENTQDRLFVIIFSMQVKIWDLLGKSKRWILGGWEL